MVAHVYPEQQRIAMVTCRDCVQLVDAPNGPVTVPVVELVQAMALAQECTEGQWAAQIETAAMTVRAQLSALETTSISGGKSDVTAVQKAFAATKPEIIAELNQRLKQVLERRLNRLEKILRTLRELDVR